MRTVPMSKSLKRALLAAMFGTLAACGGGGSSDTPPVVPPVTPPVVEPPVIPPVEPPVTPPVTPPTAAAVRVEIVQTGLLFSAVGQSRQLAARVLDASGNEIALPVSWRSSDASDIAVSDSGLASAASDSGSSQIVAAVGDIVSVPLLAVVTQLAPGTLLVDDAQIVVAPAETTPDATPSLDNRYSLVVTGIDVPAIGTLIVGSGSQPVAGRVVAAEPVAGGVRLSLQLAPATELFPNLEISQVFDLSQVEPVIAPEIAAAYDISRDGDTLHFRARADDSAGSVPAAAKASKAQAAPARRLRGSERAAVGKPQGTRAFEKGCGTDFAAENPPISMGTQPAFSVSLKPALDLLYTPSRGLERLLLTGTPTFTFDVLAKITAAFEGKISCKAELFNIPLPVGGPLSLLVGGMVPVGVGVEVGGKLTVADVTLGTKSQLSSELEVGLVCSSRNCDFQRSFGEFKVSNTPTVEFKSLASLRVEPKLEAFGYAEVAIGNRFFKSLRFKTLEAKAGAALEGSFAPQITQMLTDPYQSDYKFKLGAEAKAGSEMALTLTLLGLQSLAKLELKIDTELANSPAGSISADRGDFLAGEVTTFNVELDPAKLNFLGLYNVDEVLLVEKLADGTAAIRVRQRAAEGASRFSLAYTAPVGGTTANFFAFVVTRWLPADLLSLEIGRVRGAGLAELLRARAEAASISENCSSENCNNPEDRSVFIDDSLDAAPAARYVATASTSNVATESSIQSTGEIGVDDRGLFSTISLSCGGSAYAHGYKPENGLGQPYSAAHTQQQYEFVISQPLSYQLDVPQLRVETLSTRAYSSMSVGLAAGSELPPVDEAPPQLHGGASAAVNTSDPILLIISYGDNLPELNQEIGSRSGVLQPGVYTVATSCTHGADTRIDAETNAPDSETLSELQATLTFSAAP